MGNGRFSIFHLGESSLIPRGFSEVAAELRVRATQRAISTVHVDSNIKDV
jgi:hypothetical protein